MANSDDPAYTAPLGTWIELYTKTYGKGYVSLNLRAGFCLNFVSFEVGQEISLFKN